MTLRSPKQKADDAKADLDIAMDIGARDVSMNDSRARKNYNQDPATYDPTITNRPAPTGPLRGGNGSGDLE